MEEFDVLLTAISKASLINIEITLPRFSNSFIKQRVCITIYTKRYSK